MTRRRLWIHQLLKRSIFSEVTTHHQTGTFMKESCGSRSLNRFSVSLLSLLSRLLFSTAADSQNEKQEETNCQRDAELK